MTRKSIWTNADGLQVGFGPNYSDFDEVGAVSKDGHERELRFVLDGEKFVAGSYVFNQPAVLPAGAIPLYAHVQTTEVFALGGTTPSIQIGSTGAATRFGSATEAQAETLGTYTLTVTATPTTANTNITVTLGGTTPTVTAAGKMEVVLGYRLI
jgi:hypothetical protein